MTFFMSYICCLCFIFVNEVSLPPFVQMYLQLTANAVLHAIATC